MVRCAELVAEPPRLRAWARPHLSRRVHRRHQPIQAAARRAGPDAGARATCGWCRSERRRASSTCGPRMVRSQVRHGSERSSPLSLLRGFRRRALSCWRWRCGSSCGRSTCRSSTSARRSTGSAGRRCLSRAASSPSSWATRDVPPVLVLWLLRWLLFRLEFGAGLIKLRGDPCWRDLTCLDFHHETQPMPNPLSWYFHQLPARLHRVEVVANHVAQLVVPWFLSRRSRSPPIAAAIIVVTQLLARLSRQLLVAELPHHRDRASACSTTGAAPRRARRRAGRALATRVVRSAIVIVVAALVVCPQLSAGAATWSRAAR